MNRACRFLQITLPLALAGYLGAQVQTTPPTPTLTDVTPGLATHEKPGRHDHDPLLDLPELPKKQVTLIGGTVTKLNPIEDKLTVAPFGGGKQMRVVFDPRTKFIRNGVTAAQRDLRMGDRVYLDTMLNGTQIFAKTIWIQAEMPSGNGRGQVINDVRATAGPVQHRAGDFSARTTGGCLLLLRNDHVSRSVRKGHRH
jgi:hypothetical protein